MSRRAALPLLLLLALPCACGGGSDAPQALLAASPGLPRWQEAAAVRIPGGLLNAAGGNLLVRRVDLSLDTRLGTWEITASFNSKTRRWLWSFETSYDGDTFVDPGGAEHAALGWLADGSPIPGTAWVKRDAARIASAGGRVYEFDADGRLAAVRWSSGPYPRLDHLAATIAGHARTVEIRQCRAPGACTPLVWVDYDAAGRVVALVDRAGRVADFAWSEEGTLVSARDPLDVERSLPGSRYEYRGEGRLVALTSSEGERVEYRWHPRQGRLVEARAIGAGDPTWRFEYAIGADPEAPFESRIVDPLGGATLYRFDGERRLRRLELATGEVATQEWAGFEVVRVDGPRGAVTSFEREGLELTRTDPGGNAVHVVFAGPEAENRADPARRAIARVEDALGPIESRGYDGQGRLVWIENGAGEPTHLAWNAENLLASATPPDGSRIDYLAYGEHGHAEATSAHGELETRVFDAVGNLVSSSGRERTDLRPGGEVRRLWDADRNLAELVLADLPAAGPAVEASIRLEWRSDHRLLRIERPGGADHEFDYDALGRLVARRERSGGVWRTTQIEVDALGRIVAETLPNGMRREQAWDAAGRPIGLVARRGPDVEGELAVRWEDGRPVAFDDSTSGGVERWTWGADGEVEAIDYPGGERLELSRDLRGRVVRETYRLADGSALREIGTSLDAAGRLAGIDEDGDLRVAHVRVAGRLVQSWLGNGLLRSFSWDATGLPTGSVGAPPGGSAVEIGSVARVRDDAASVLRVEAVTTSAGAIAATDARTLTLAPLGGAGKRLAASGAAAAQRAWAMDALANATFAGDERFVYDPEGSRLLARVDAASGELRGAYAWDEAGFCLARGSVALRWTALGRIAAIGDDATFAWDLRGRPLARTRAGAHTRWLFGGRVEADAGGTPLRLDLGEVAIRLDTGERRYRHRDFRGNVALESDDLGRVVAHLVYGPYGVEARLGDPDVAATFAGGLDLGDLVLLGGRLLEPASGRFLAPDPLLQLVNQYAYALGNPVAFWDPDGRAWVASGFYYGAFAAAGGGLIAGGVGAASGSAVLGTVVGGPIGAVLGLAVAQSLYQLANPGERGPFGLEEMLEQATPLYLAPPEARSHSSAPAGFEGASLGSSSGCGCTPAPTLPTFRFGAWSAGGVGGAVGGGFGGL